MKSIEELVAQVKQLTYPDWTVDIDRFLLEYTTRFLAAYTEQQEPVATVRIWNDINFCNDSWTCEFVGERLKNLNVGEYKLYAAPVVPADMVLVPRELSDKTSDLLGVAYGHSPCGWKITYARILAMIAAVEKKS